MPGKFPVQGLPGAKRRDAKAAGRSALDRELSRRQDHPARGGRPGRSGRRGQPGVRDGGDRLAAGAGKRRCGGGPRRASQTLRQRAWTAAPSGEIPSQPQPLTAGPQQVQRFPWWTQRPCPEPGRGRRPGTPEGRALEDVKKSCHTSDNTCCLGWSFGGFRWSEGGREPRTASRGLTTHVYSSA